GHIHAPGGSADLEPKHGCTVAAAFAGGFEVGNGVSFDFHESYDNWTWTLDVPGLVVDFEDPGFDSRVDRLVPPGSSEVTVCTHTAVNTDFTLTFTPPTPSQEYVTEWIVGVRSARCVSPAADDLMPQRHDGEDGVTYDRFAIDPKTRGDPFRVYVRGDSPAKEGVGLTFYDAEDERLAGGAGAWHYSTGATGWQHTGVVPEEAETAVFWSCASGPLQLHYRAASPDGFETRTFNGEHGLLRVADLAILTYYKEMCAWTTTGVFPGGVSVFGWELPTALPDGAPASVERLQFHYVGSPTALHAIISVRDANGDLAGRDVDDLVLTNVAPGKYRIDVSPCTAASGEFKLEALAELSAATSHRPVSGEDAPVGYAQSHQATWTSGIVSGWHGVCYANGGVFNEGIGFQMALDGVAFDAFDLNDAAVGAHFQATFVRTVTDGRYLIEPVGISFLSRDGNPIYSASTLEEPIEHVVPPEARTGILWSCASGPMQATFTAFHGDPEGGNEK
ncbi:MAG TPA: hypothetical protein VGB18_03680, partial [Candidatus Thermoplasmatota archaeon]